MHFFKKKYKKIMIFSIFYIFIHTINTIEQFKFYFYFLKINLKALKNIFKILKFEFVMYYLFNIYL